jgi:hypothetical protein
MYSPADLYCLFSTAFSTILNSTKADGYQNVASLLSQYEIDTAGMLLKVISQIELVPVLMIISFSVLFLIQIVWFSQFYEESQTRRSSIIVNPLIIELVELYSRSHNTKNYS